MIRFKQVYFSFPNQPEVEILKGIDLSIYEGEFLTIIGHNGSGKSTLAKHMNGLLLPTKGKVVVDGELATSVDQDIWKIRQRVGMVFQNPDNQFVAPTVLDDVAFGLENLGVPREDMMSRMEKALRQVGMWDYRDREPHRLSGGQKQRVAIAGVLAMKPKLVVLDESTAMLDPMGRKEVIKTVTELRNEGITVVNITHYLEEALSSDRVVVMNDGQIFRQGSPQEIFKEIDVLKGIGLDVPFSVELAARLRKRGFAIEEEVWHPQQLVERLWTLL
ncbi:energy-coupling factor transporter ATPase [Ammoniphilus sp. CFH 90114]|uniref:energy-coupling factor transporter ATPase n=1 Tax=Ammoniphilus sp. CFH 90114 TaxID=2493665 RepID=UPI00100E0AFA|nr:energy-coupling factor transporter ATPase [Ammoniphilus sp. CFH 90114]RXT05339.1 energy-coupling factor transporter ATPase [Ammoniphilus sp. CFH 90114]